MADTRRATQASDSLRRIARKLCWWQTEEQALKNPIRFVAQVMTYGTWDDVRVLRNEWGDELFVATLHQAPSGVFDERSWNYWHLVFGIRPVPPLPKRTLE